MTIHQSSAYGQLWAIVSGAVADALNTHPDYLTRKGQRSAATSITKRVTGTVLSFAEQSARGRPRPAETNARAALPERPASPSTGDASGEAVIDASLNPHCRIGKVRFKRRTRYRAAGVFDLTTSALLRSARA
jgi:hypothetical protein